MAIFRPLSRFYGWAPVVTMKPFYRTVQLIKYPILPSSQTNVTAEVVDSCSSPVIGSRGMMDKILNCSYNLQGIVTFVDHCLKKSV